jgi:hypothetical protein
MINSKQDKKVVAKIYLQHWPPGKEAGSGHLNKYEFKGLYLDSEDTHFCDLSHILKSA